MKSTISYYASLDEMLPRHREAVTWYVDDWIKRRTIVDRVSFALLVLVSVALGAGVSMVVSNEDLQDDLVTCETNRLTVPECRDICFGVINEQP